MTPTDDFDDGSPINFPLDTSGPYFLGLRTKTDSSGGSSTAQQVTLSSGDLSLIRDVVLERCPD